MPIETLPPLFVALLLAAGQSKAERLSPAELADVRALVAAADRAIKGEVSPERRLRLTWHALKAPDGRTYVPFTLAIEDVPEDAFSSVALYVRVARRGERRTSAELDRRVGPTGVQVPVFAFDAAASASAALRLLDRPDQPHDRYAYEAAHFTPVWWAEGTGIVRRAFVVPPGRYDIYIAVREQAAAVPPGREPRTALLKQALDVPDLSRPGLAMSTPILAERVEPLSRPLEPEEQLARPYALGSAEIVPASAPVFTASDRPIVFFLVYHAGMDGNGKPDVEVTYRIARAGAEAEPVGPPRSVRYDASTLAPEFDLRVGHQLAPLQPLDLEGLTPGSYRLQIQVTDRLGRAAVSHDIAFTIR
ncbi:MAG TPA: hypothetical protein VNI83_04145 [Vicinamibacterales bacterium]|nr:hypothetical protein [Vicinamibacterales bacterium]